MPADVSIVVPTWNGRHLLERFLPSVLAAADWYAAHDHGGVEILVVDDGSDDGTSEWVRDLSSRAPAPVRLVRHDRNLGFGAAANHGVAEAAHRLVWLLNNDVEVSIDGVLALASDFDPPDPNLVAVHSRMVDLTTNEPVGTGKMGGFARGFLRIHRSFVTLGRSSGPFWSMFATGGSAMFQRTLFLELGGFDPIFAPFYLEDVELSYRAWKRGHAVRYEPRSVVRHQFSSTIGPLASRRVERISQRNRLLFHWIHLHDSRFLAQHVGWTAVLLLTAPLTMRWGFVLGLFDALRRLPEAMSRRARERRRAARSDRDVLRVFADLAASGEIHPYDNPRELDRSILAELSGNAAAGVRNRLR